MLTFFWLLVGHALCDYPLQGDFLAKGKNHTNPLPGIPWYQCLFWHAMIHAGAVVFITQNVWLGCFELILHMMIDYTKCESSAESDKEQKFEYNKDQFFHVVCKVLYVLLLKL
jgi:hypothetical protein